LARNRAGLDGKRSSAFWPFWRLMQRAAPRSIVIENVCRSLTSHDGREFGAVMIDAALFVPQSRERAFITAGSLDSTGFGGPPSSSSARAWRYSAHELGAIDLIARERLRSCRDDLAWGDLSPSFDPLRFGLRSVVNAAKHGLAIAPAGAGLALVLFQHYGHLQRQNHRCVSPVKLGEPRCPPTY
jgi:hypothetical protein